MNANACVTGVARKSAALLNLSCHTYSLLPKTLVETYCSTGRTRQGNYVGTGGQRTAGLCTNGVKVLRLDSDARRLRPSTIQALNQRFQAIGAFRVHGARELHSHAAAG